MFKHAYVRGIQNAMIQGKHAAFPDAEAAAKVADYIADHVDFDPFKPVSREVTAKIAEAVLEASTQLQKRAGFKAASFTQIGSLEDLSKLAHAHAIHLMEKAAEGSTIEGGDKGNKEQSSAEGKMDAKQRPDGYAEDSRGKTDVDTRPGAVGKEQDQPNKPTETPAGSNSVTDQSRTASLEERIKKLAAGTGSTIMGGDKGNKEMSSAEAKMDATQRPPGYAVLPSQGALGELMKQVGGPAVVGKETAQPNGPSNSPSGSNSVTQHSAKAASEDPYVSLFKATAAEVSPYLPSAMHEDTKIAHVRALMGMTTEEKAHYLHGLQKEAADKTTPAVPPGSRGDGYQGHNPEATHSRPGAYDGRKANQGTKQAEDGALPPFMMQKKDEEKKDGEGEKKDEKKDGEGEKKDDEKSASLRDHFRRIAATVQPNA